MPKTWPGPRLLIVLGAILAAAALLWASSMDDHDHRVDVERAKIECAMRGALDCDLPTVNYTGPIILAAAGAFLILCGVILLAGRRD